MSYNYSMRTTKTAIQIAALNSSINSLVQAVRNLKSAGEPVLLMRVSGLLKELMLSKNDSTLSQ